MEIIPAILEKNFEEIAKKLDFLSQIEDKYSIDFKFVQIDLCDGKFVNNETWLPDSSKQEEITKLLSYKNYFNLEFHLMCEDQLKYFLEVENFKPKSVVIHLDEILFSKDLEEILNRAKKSLTRIIAAAKLDFLDKNREEILSLLYKHEKTDLQIMGIEKIGLQGQEFSEKALALVRYFRNNLDYKDLSIQIDGSMNENTISFATKAGADKFIVGSYLLKDLEEEKFVANLRKLRRS